MKARLSMTKSRIKNPQEFAKDTWIFNGKTYYQVDYPDEVEGGRYSAMAIEEGAKADDNGEYRCVELYLTFNAEGLFDGVERVKRSSLRWDGIEGSFVDESIWDGLTLDEFADAVRGCDCTEAEVEGNLDIGVANAAFTFDCMLDGPAGRFCASGMMLVDENQLITDVLNITIRDFSNLGENAVFGDAPIINDEDEIAGALEMLAERFVHE